MGRLHAAEPLFICCHWWGAFSRGDSHSRGSREDVELLLEERVPDQCPSFPRRNLQHHLVDRGCPVKAGSGSQLFLPWNHSWRRWPFRLFPAWTAARWTGGVWLGKGIPRWGLQSRISVFCPGAAPAGRHSTRKRPDVGNILAYFAHQSGFQSREHLFRVSCLSSSKVGFIVSTNCEYLLQVYQLTTLFLRDSVEELPAFTVKLNGIALSRRLLEKSIACVQDFVRSPGFTQRDFFSDNGINLLVSAVNAAGSMPDQSTCEPWASVLPDSCVATLVDLRKKYDVVVVRRKDTRDTSERWFGVRSVESSEVGEPSCRAGVRISNVVEVGRVEYLSGSVPVRDQPCGSTTVSPRSPGKGKRKRRDTPTVGPKRIFEFDDESVVLPKGRGVYFEDPNFECALKSQEETAASRRSGRSRRAAPIF